MESGINKYWKQLYQFDIYVSHDCHFMILDRTWDDYGGNFFLRPNIKELNLWI
jgi:hypothetical protein